MTDIKFHPFTKLFSTVKAAQSELPLAPLTCICGEEATGKSSLGDAIRLGVRGEHWRVRNQPSKLLGFAANPAQGIEVRLESPSGMMYWKLPVDKAGVPHEAAAPAYTGDFASIPESARPFIITTDPVRGLMTDAKGAAKMREAVLRRWGGSINSLPEPIGLSEVQSALWKKALDEIKARTSGETTPDVVLSALTEYFRTKAGAATRALTPLRKAIDERKAAIAKAEASGALRGAEAYSTLATQLDAATVWENSAASRATIKQLEESIRSGEQACAQLSLQIDKLSVDAETANLDTFETLKKTLDDLRLTHAAEVAGLTAKIQLAESLAKQHKDALDRGETRCLFCRSPADLRGLHTFFSTRTTQRQGELETTCQVHAKAQADMNTQIDAARSALASAQRKVAEKTAEHAQLKARVDGMRGRLAQLKDTTADVAPYTGPSVAVLRPKVDSIRGAVAARAALKTDAETLRQREGEAEDYRILAQEAAALQLSVIDDVADLASTEVSMFMPGGRKAILSPESMEWTVTGRDGRNHPFGIMCGTEETNLMFAWDIAWSAKAPFRVGLYDDRNLIGLSTKGWRDFFEACEKAYDAGAVHQFIIIMNRPELVPTKRWLKLELSSTALSPDEVLV